MEKIFEVHPKRPISGVLPNGKRIMGVTRLALSRAEFLRCMNSGTVFAIVDGNKVLVTELDYEKALGLFDRQVNFNTRTVNLVDVVTQPLPAVRQDNIEVKPKESLPVEIVNTAKVEEDQNVDKSLAKVKQEVKNEKYDNSHDRQTSISSKKKK